MSDRVSGALHSPATADNDLEAIVLRALQVVRLGANPRAAFVEFASGEDADRFFLAYAVNQGRQTS